MGPHRLNASVSDPEIKTGSSRKRDSFGDAWEKVILERSNTCQEKVFRFVLCAPHVGWLSVNWLPEGHKPLELSQWISISAVALLAARSSCPRSRHRARHHLSDARTCACLRAKLRQHRC